jgi:hypothetical protein
MADVSIDSTISTTTARGFRSVVFTTPLIGYSFYVNSDGTFAYSKTTDGGSSWGVAVTINSTTTQIAFDVWFDQWTPGDTGTLIHTWYFDSTNDIIYWRSLNTNGDTLGTERAAFTGASAVLGRGAFCSGTKSRSGYLYVAFDIDVGAEHGIVRSTDGGTTWSSNLATSFVETNPDACSLFPASNTGDNNDIWAVYLDQSAAAITLKMWDSSAAAQTESTTIQTHTYNAFDLTGQYGWSAAVRQSDGHLILVACSESDTATADMQAWDINGTGSISALTNLTTNIDDNYYPQVFINQDNNNIFVAYNGARDGSSTAFSSTKVYYTKSTDGGTTWAGGDTAYSEAAAGAINQLWVPISGPVFYVVWRAGTTLNGSFVNRQAFHKLTTVQGSYTLTGEAAGLLFGRKATVAQGSYVLTGEAVTLSRTSAGIILTAAQGAYALTGEAANLLFGRKLSTTQGSYTLTGESANLLFGRKMAATQGAYVLTGETVNLLYGRKLVAAEGSYILTGEDAALLFGRKLSAVQGAYDLSGEAANLLFGRRVTSATGLYILTGEDADFAIGVPGAIIFSVNAGSYVFTGETVNLSVSGGAVTTFPGAGGGKPRRNVIVPVTGVQANAAIGDVIVRITPLVRVLVTGVQSYSGIGTPRIHVVATALRAPMPTLSAIGYVRAITITDLLDDEIAAILG